MKKMSNLTSSYADALFEISIEQNNLDEILSQTLRLREILKDNGDFVKFLNAPMISKDEKIALVDKVFSVDADKTLLNYIKVMIGRKDTLCLDASLEEFENLYNKHNNIEKAVAVTAVPMSDDMKAKLVRKLEKVTGKKVVLENKVDESCIGGVVLEFSDRQYNDSIAAKLANLKNQLKHI